MKKLKGFTLVELIVVLAIFSMIMAAVLSLLNPVADVYSSTANYEHARAASDNVRLYLQDNIKYADNLKIIYNAADATAANQAAIDRNTALNDKYSASPSMKPQVYILEVANDNHGNITIYKDAVNASNVYKQINQELYKDYSYEFVIPSDFGVTNAAVDMNIYKYSYKTGTKALPLETDSDYYKLTTAATFSFINLRNFANNMPVGTEIKYITQDGIEVPEEQKDNPGVIKLDATKQESNPFSGCVNGGVDGGNIYFIYTLPKFVNEY